MLKPNQHLPSLVLALCISGCLLPPGQAWQPAELQVDAVFDMDGRILENGKFKTSKDYEISFESIELSGLGFRTEALPSNTGLSLFDPQNPPPGYTLCHNGHCHNKDNELIDYEDIQEELNQASGAAATVLFQALEEPLALTDFSETIQVPLKLGPCNDPYQVCELGADAQVAKVVFEPASLSISMIVFHEDDFPAQGLKVESKEIMLSSSIELTLVAPPPIINGTLPIQIILEKSLWDSIEFTDLTQSNDSTESIVWNEQALEQAILKAALQHINLQLQTNP